MAVAHAFSPKEFKVAIASDATNAGATGIGSTMYQLDVDSVSYPSLNLTQALEVRSGAGRTFNEEDRLEVRGRLYLADTEMRLKGSRAKSSVRDMPSRSAE